MCVDHEERGERYRVHKEKTLDKLHTSKSNTLYTLQELCFMHSLFSGIRWKIQQMHGWHVCDQSSQIFGLVRPNWPGEVIHSNAMVHTE